MLYEVGNIGTVQDFVPCLRYKELLGDGPKGHEVRTLYRRCAYGTYCNRKGVVLKERRLAETFLRWFEVWNTQYALDTAYSWWETLGSSFKPKHRVYRVPGFLSSRTKWVPPPHPQDSVAPPIWVPRGVTHSLAREGVEGPKSDSGALGIL